jgi:hypothetical protein
MASVTILPWLFLPNRAAPVALSASTPDVKNFCGAENTSPLGKRRCQFNILTSVGDNDSLQIAIGKGNLITKVGSGHSAMIAIGKANTPSIAPLPIWVIILA